ncbi:hypothetical protein [Stenotrophomonas maltophilia]|uniref:hypothetical protein n=1 Tax=Stenotrophomonas maltophilia TaxID=40324 RepID=UPI0015C5225D|nr:hypothetical protein [Stenotrophomonas maltophilia]
MSNDKTTLADVKPGGRVRLGDRPKDGEVIVEVSGLTGSGKSAIAGEIEILCRTLGLEVEWVNGDEEKRLTHADWIGALEMYKPKVVIVEQNISRAALSAQPSPGGQGDAPFAWSERAKSDALEAGQYAFTEADGNGLGYTACIEACVDAICLVLEMPEHRVALAARQPVRICGCCSQPEGELHTAECPNMRHLASRQPVGEITDTEIDARLNALYREMVDSGQHNGGMSGVAWDRAVFRTASKQPAQAVDLGPVRSALQAAAGLCDCCASVDGYSRGELNAFGQNMRSQFTDALALLDSQAVGK